MLEGDLGPQPCCRFRDLGTYGSVQRAPEQVYLIPVSDFPDHKYIWPFTKTLLKYERYAYEGLRALFGLIG
ncbi:hypothetical protein GCM10009094_42150 [Massilia aurea]